MTCDEVLAMKPGSKLDLLVCEKVMKWITPWEPFFPSTDISAAWEVVEKVLERGGCEIGCYGSKNGAKWFEVNVITMNGEVTVTAHTAPEAICKAALLAVMGE